jgi:AcrR family transcriptional regulator
VADVAVTISPQAVPVGKTPRYGRKLEGILRKAAAVICTRGYHQASMRGISRATGVSLAGLYYYFSSKEHLLYLIQRCTFENILASSSEAIRRQPDPESRLRAFIELHLKYFLDRPNEMKVINHEEALLGADLRREVNALKKAYYRVCLEQVKALKQARRLTGLNTRIAALSLFGMMNWIYTWHNPRVDPGAGELARQMADLFLKGIAGYKAGKTAAQRLAEPMARQGPHRRQPALRK